MSQREVLAHTQGKSYITCWELFLFRKMQKNPSTTIKGFSNLLNYLQYCMLQQMLKQIVLHFSMNSQSTAPVDEDIYFSSTGKRQIHYIPNYPAITFSQINKKCFIPRSDLKKLTPLFRPKGRIKHSNIIDSLLNCPVRRELISRKTLSGNKSCNQFQNKTSLKKVK